MAKKKVTGGKHQTPRKHVALPAEWYDVAADLASAQKMPTAWFVIDLIRLAAEANGTTDMPPLPWATEPREEKKK